MFNNENDILTVEELMEMLNIGQNYAYRLLNSGKIKGFRIGRSWRISRKEVYKFVDKATSLENLK